MRYSAGIGIEGIHAQSQVHDHALKFHLVLHISIDGIRLDTFLAEPPLICDEHQVSIRRAGIGDDHHHDVPAHKFNTALEQVALCHLRSHIHLQTQPIAITNFPAGGGSSGVKPVGVAPVVDRCCLIYAAGIC